MIYSGVGGAVFETLDIPQGVDSQIWSDKVDVIFKRILDSLVQLRGLADGNADGIPDFRQPHTIEGYGPNQGRLNLLQRADDAAGQPDALKLLSSAGATKLAITYAGGIRFTGGYRTVYVSSAANLGSVYFTSTGQQDSSRASVTSVAAIDVVSFVLPVDAASWLSWVQPLTYNMPFKVALLQAIAVDAMVTGIPVDIHFNLGLQVLVRRSSDGPTIEADELITLEDMLPGTPGTLQRMSYTLSSAEVNYGDEVIVKVVVTNYPGGPSIFVRGVQLGFTPSEI